MAKKIAITKLGVGSFGKLVGTINGVIGLAAGIIAAVVASVSVVTNNDFTILTDILVTIGILLTGIFVYPLLAFALGWLHGAIIALIFNLIVGISGGLEVSTEDIKEAK